MTKKEITYFGLKIHENTASDSTSKLVEFEPLYSDTARVSITANGQTLTAHLCPEDLDAIMAWLDKIGCYLSEVGGNYKEDVEATRRRIADLRLRNNVNEIPF